MSGNQHQYRDEARPLGSNYLLISLLGSGSMGQVWRAVDRAGRPYAIKVLLPGLSNDAELVRRFVTERSIAIDIDSPYVVRVRDMVVEGQTLAIVMDLVDGTDLRTRLAANGPLAPAEAALLGSQIADGLAAVHSHGIVHRDVKPGNVLLDPGPPESARLTDFGISFLSDSSHLSHVTAVVGTPNYMAPEIINGRRPTAASDLYSLGIMLYELVCGVTPFSAASTMTVLRNHCEFGPGRPEGFPEPLWQVVSGLLAKDPAQRPAGAAEVATALSAAVPSLIGMPPMDRLSSPPPAIAPPASASSPSTPSSAAPSSAQPAAPAAETHVRRLSATPITPAPTRRRGRRGILVGVLAVAVVGGAAGGYLALRPDGNSSGQGGAAIAATTGPTGASSPRAASSAPSRTPRPTPTPTPSSSPTVVDAATSAYRNARYGFSFTAPVGWTRTDDADGGVTFTSPDKKATMRAYGLNQGLSSCGGSADACQERAKSQYRAAGASITDWRWGAEGDNWYFVSGVRANGSQYYERRSLGKASSNVLMIDLPAAEGKQLSGVIATASGSFKPGDVSVTH